MFIGADLGTSSVKLLLCGGGGEYIDSASMQLTDHFPREGWSEEHPADWWAAFCACARELAGRNELGGLKAIAFSGQMHGAVLLDAMDRVIRPAILWNDGRCAAQCERLNALPVVEWTGNRALTGFTAPKLVWLRENERDSFERIARVMLPKDYLVHRLTGNYVTDTTDASGTLLFDVKRKCWSADMLDAVGLTPANVPEVLKSTDRAGAITADAARETGLPEGVAVIAGSGDQAACAVGTGTVTEGDLSISLGTSGVVFAPCDEYRADESARLHSFCHANGRYHLMGVTLACTASAKWWVEDVLYSDYAGELSGIAEGEPDGALFLPYMMGERSPINDPDARGEFAGLSLGCTRRRMTRAVIEGVCFSLRDCLMAVREQGVGARTARVTGGGARSDDWMQLIADITGLTVTRINAGEGGAMGAVIMAAVAAGAFSSMEEGCRALIRDEAFFYPRNTDIYDAKFERYVELSRSRRHL